MRLFLAATFLLGTCTTALAECAVSDIEKALGSSLDGFRKTEMPVTDIQSTEGGVWRIYQKPDGALEALIRIDAGESGMGETRLAIVNADAFGISQTRVDYLRHAFIDDAGPNGTAKRTTEYYYYCNGKLYLPPEQFATLENNSYAERAEESRKRMLEDKDVAELTRFLERNDN